MNLPSGTLYGDFGSPLVPNAVPWSTKYFLLLHSIAGTWVAAICCSRWLLSSRFVCSMDPSYPSGLFLLPSELYLKVTSYLFLARDVKSLSLTCKKFHRLNEKDGWRSFVRVNFPTILIHSTEAIEGPEWRNFARSLTDQSRAWDRRAIFTSNLDISQGEKEILRGINRLDYPPSQNQSGQMKLLQHLSNNHGTTAGGTTELQNRNEASNRGQSIAYTPVLASKVEYEGRVGSKKSIVAWSTGPELFIRVDLSGSYLCIRKEDLAEDLELLGRMTSSTNFSVQHEMFRPGTGDITSINIVDPSTFRYPDSLTVDVIVGRSNGYIHRFSLSNDSPSHVIVNEFYSLDADGQPQREDLCSADVSSGNRRLLAACSKKRIALYETASESHTVLPLHTIQPEFDQQQSRAWSTKFLSPEILAVSLGQSAQPVHLYQLTSSDIILTRKLSMSPSQKTGTAQKTGTQQFSNTVFAVEPLSAASVAGGSSAGKVFLCGGYDGVCRLFDTRVPEVHVNAYHNNIDGNCSIYSLATIGQERFVAGNSQSSLSIFDFRMGKKVYQYTDALPCSSRSAFPRPHNYPPGVKVRGFSSYEELNSPHCSFIPSDRRCHFHTTSRMELFQPNSMFWLYGKSAGFQNDRRGHPLRNVSPIYALSSPGSSCPVIYAGVTGRVYELQISELGKGGFPHDIWFGQNSKAFNRRATKIGVSMLETDNGCELENGDTAQSVVLRMQAVDGLKMNEPIQSSAHRLDRSWHSAQDFLPF